MVLKPGPHGVVFALPGMLLSAWIFLISIAGYASGTPLGLAAGIAGVGLAFGVTWLPVVLYLAGTRLTVGADGLELRQWFGLRTRKITRAEIGGVARAEGSVAADGGDSPGIPVAYYDLLDRKGKRWARLRSWVWRRSDCERLRQEIMNSTTQPAPAAAVRPARETRSPAGAALDVFPGFLQSAGCMVQGCSMLFGFGLAAVIVAGEFHLPMGRQLGAASVPGAVIGLLIGAAAFLSAQVYSGVKQRNAFVAKVVALASLLVIPIVLWAAVLLVFSAIVSILGRSSG